MRRSPRNESSTVQPYSHGMRGIEVARSLQPAQPAAAFDNLEDELQQIVAGLQVTGSLKDERIAELEALCKSLQHSQMV